MGGGYRRPGQAQAGQLSPDANNSKSLFHMFCHFRNEKDGPDQYCGPHSMY